jgi:hypothetical protein
MMPNVITDYRNKATCNRFFEHYQITFQEGTKQATTVCEALKMGIENMKQATEKCAALLKLHC